ncbi:hypothetical protein VHEMI01922 [[Torrubiella] hemipterigena]|uniref:Uncharacterized protein n=1 Tax=[Torrubiella] hemipterigena TaxID=1531966 RepID=A0A0A1T692_9HYPO|nr:hypothetical protein VHEMI01922 [[Torrubiella] hemipterigena]
MSKQFDDDELPPPYTLPADVPAYASSSSSAQPRSHLFASHLTALRSEISSEQAARLSVQDQSDNNTLSLIIPYVEELLSSISSIHPPPSLVEATLVPDAVIDSTWKPTDDDERRDGEYRSVIRITQHTKMPTDTKQRPVETNNTGGSSSGFSDWGRMPGDAPAAPCPSSTLWWSDERTARRLAKHLQPGRPTLSVDRQTVQARAEENRKASRWNPFKMSSGDIVPRPPASRSADNSEDITMKISPREVTFRKENAFGIWESITGWGIHIQVRIRQS